MRKKLKWTALILTLIFIGLQFTTPAHTNPHFVEAQTLQGMTAVPSDGTKYGNSQFDCNQRPNNPNPRARPQSLFTSKSDERMGPGSDPVSQPRHLDVDAVLARPLPKVVSE